MPLPSYGQPLTMGHQTINLPRDNWKQERSPSSLPLEPTGRTAPELLSILRGMVSESLQLTLTQNIRTYLSFRRRKGSGIHLRLHRHFLRADNAVLRSVTTILSKPSDVKSRQILKRFWMSREVLEPRPKRRSQPKCAQGEVYDLKLLLDEVVSKHTLRGDLPTIGWGKRINKGRRRRSIRLGSYDFENTHITIHRALDDKAVPAYVLRQVVYHELLHHEIDVIKHGERRILHSAEFRRREADSADYAPSEAWIKRNLSKLLGGL